MRTRNSVILFASAAVLGSLVTACSDDTTSNPTSSATSSSSSSSGTGGTGGAGGGMGGAGGGMGGTGGAGGGMGGAGGGMGGSGGGMMALPDLDPNLAWYGMNRERLDTLIDEKGANSPNYDPAKKPVAMFDWDNTVIKNDVGDLVFFWMVKNDKVIQPPGKDWKTTNPYLTTAAHNALKAACGSLANQGMPLPTSTNAACADELLAVYTTGMTKGGTAAFAGWNYRTMEPAYAWAAQVQAGYMPSEMEAMATTAIDEGLAAAQGSTQMIGTTTVNAWVRVYDQIKDLISVMQANGFDVWIITASPESNVKAFAPKVNIAPEKVIGIRNLKDAQGRLTYNFEGCGAVLDGSGNGSPAVVGNSMITYIEGKRCWINKVVYGMNGPDTALPNADPTKRAVFGAGDSDTDISFLQDATTLKLAINRNKKELMCNAYANYMDKWIVNPMFIEPKGQQTSPYACSTSACKDALGNSGPCLDESGMVITDQMDTVY